ncbi:L-histidine N(alpha)-methyltransferase [bacterium]|nr:L-histidine N(alpha)-methyltransferase [bacterium]
MKLYNYAPTTDSLYEEVLRGLGKNNKTLPGALLYDERGSQLFEKICEQPEYYLTRTELQIMQQSIDEIVALLGKDVALVEYGSGSSTKTAILLDHLPELACYIPIDISKEHLLQAAEKLARQYLHLEILPVCADYSQPFHLPPSSKVAMRYVAYYPGSTVSHFLPQEAVDFLAQIRQVCGPDSRLLIGVDLKKDPRLIEPAYNDAAGYSRAFTSNILTHINRRFGADFANQAFAYQAFFDSQAGRVEFYLVSQQSQTVHLNGVTIDFQAGERINLAYSYKYSLYEFAELAAQAGWRVQQVWTDEQQLFSVQYLTTYHTRTSHMEDAYGTGS